MFLKNLILFNSNVPCLRHSTLSINIINVIVFVVRVSSITAVASVCSCTTSTSAVAFYREAIAPFPETTSHFALQQRRISTRVLVTVDVNQLGNQHLSIQLSGISPPHNSSFYSTMYFPQPKIRQEAIWNNLRTGWWTPMRPRRGHTTDNECPGSNNTEWWVTQTTRQNRRFSLFANTRQSDQLWLCGVLVREGISIVRRCFKIRYEFNGTLLNHRSYVSSRVSILESDKITRRRNLQLPTWPHRALHTAVSRLRLEMLIFRNSFHHRGTCAWMCRTAVAHATPTSVAAVGTTKAIYQARQYIHRCCACKLFGLDGSFVG